MNDNLRERLILALDVDSEREALEIVEDLHDLIGYFKIGMQLYYSVGNSLIEKIHYLGGKVFLDLKLHDIPNTVQNGARVLANLGVEMTNFHATGGPQMLKSASLGLKEAEVEKPPIGIAVTILTSLSKDDLKEIGIKEEVKQSVRNLAIMTKKAGLAGVVCSPQEIKIVKEACGEDFLTITPGIRPSWSVKNDQKRITTPYQAIKDGGDYLVIGRPIRNAENRREAAKLVLEEMKNGYNDYLKGRL
ncbi:MAG: orotidine-5'-phosphate decarboxylase [Clostridia bacterium]